MRKVDVFVRVFYPPTLYHSIWHVYIHVYILKHHVCKASLVTNYGEGGGGDTKREGSCEVLPLRKGGGAEDKKAPMSVSILSILKINTDIGAFLSA